MKSLPILVILGLAGFGLYRWASRTADAAVNLAYEPRGIKWGKKRRIIARIAIVNTAATPVWFDEVHLNAYYNGNDLGAVNLQERTVVPANGEAVKEFPFQVSLTGVAQAIFEAVTSGKDGARSLILRGYVRAGAVRVPIEITQEITKPKAA
jgi:LEA14-like dessication related protein